MSAIDPYVTAAYRKGAGYPPDPAYVDFIKAFDADPPLVESARNEIARLADPSGRRTLSEHDHESRLRHQTLTNMMAEFDARKPA